MSYFPIFIDMKNKNILVVGAGRIASEKLEKLIGFTKNITIIAPKVNKSTQVFIEKYNLSLYLKEYAAGDIKGYDIVIVAAAESLQKEIYKESQDYNILVNSVDNKAYCDFLFPSYIQKGDLTIAFSTAGASPVFAKKIRKYVSRLLPDTTEEFLEDMKNLRKKLPKGKDRMRYFEKKVDRYFKKYFKY